jgi:hypothetical protein
MDCHPLILVGLSFLASVGVTCLARACGWEMASAARVTSTIHSLVVSGVGSYVVYSTFDPDAFFPGEGLPREDADVWLFASPELPTFSLTLTLGYLLCDLLVGLLLSELTPGMWAHHLLISLAFTASIATGIGVLFCSYLLVNEASTPFVNVFHWTKQTWRGDARALCNGVCMWLSFLVFRIIFNAAVLLSIYRTSSKSETFRLYPVFMATLFGAYAILQCLNWYWFFLISKGLLKALEGGPPAATATGTGAAVKGTAFKGGSFKGGSGAPRRPAAVHYRHG